jgi:hypothetical protein
MMTVFHLTSSQRRNILRLVAEHSPDGRTFHLDQLPVVLLNRFGVDLGRALLNLDCDGLCGTEDPDIVWSTPEGLKAALA